MELLAPSIVAELLYDQIKRDHPDLAADTNAYLIGFTDAGMYSVNNNWDYSFTQRYDQRAAVISSESMQEKWWERNQAGVDANQRLQARLRRILLKDVAILYWHLPLNNDPSSVVQNFLEPDIPAEDIYESDLQRARTAWGESKGEPCFFLSYSKKEGMKPSPGTFIRSCSDIPEHDDSVELFEVDLGPGLLIDKPTDFELPGLIPIEFQRALRGGWSGSNPFGISGTDNYDEFLISPDNVHISLVHNDGGRDELVRSPLWLPILSLVKYVDRDYSGNFYEMRWHSSPFGHYDLKHFGGDVKTFLPCSGFKQFCYLIGYKNAKGQALEFERDHDRKLIQLTSPNRSWLHFSYAAGNRISEINDSHGRKVSYDERQRLTSVTYPSGEVLYYEYDNTQNLLTFSASSDAKTTPHVLLQNEYVHGRIVKQTFADGEAYTYSYYPATDPIRKIIVNTSDGKVFYVDITADGSIVRERDALPEPKKLGAS